MEFSIKGWLGVTGGGPIQKKYQNRAFSGSHNCKKILRNFAGSHPVSELRPDSLYEGNQNLKVPTNHNNEVGN